MTGRQPCSNNYQVFCNNFFSTAGLFEELLQQNIYTCGTAQIDRHGFPETLKKVAITERGQHKSCQRGNLVATVWKDKKDAKMLSTMCDPCTTQTVERKQKDASKITIPCPEAVVVYNKYMGGVDQGDQFRHYSVSGQNASRTTSIYFGF